MKEEAKVNYAFALKNYQQNGWGRSMKKFCEEEGYDYEKFMQYSRRGQKENSVFKEADARQTSDKFIPLIVDGPAESVLGILVREHNRFELTQIRLDAGKFFKPIMLLDEAKARLVDKGVDSFERLSVFGEQLNVQDEDQLSHSLSR